MKKFELVAAVAKETGLTQENVNKVVDSLSAVIVKECVTNGGDVNLPALGKFRQKVNPAREGINPLTKQPLSIKETRTIRFTPTSGIKVTIEPKGSAKKK